jgi:hypothetical protein
MIKLEFPKTNLNAYESAEDKVKALKGQVDTLSTNLQIILDSIDESIDEDAIKELVSPDIDSINRGMREISDRVADIEDRVTDIEDADYGTRVDELESHDFIAEQGTSGIWTYRKWNSGIAECWARKQFTNVAVTTSWGSGYYASIGLLADYPFAFADYPCVNMTLQASTGNGWGIYNNSNYSVSNAGSVFVYNPSSQSAVNITVNAHAIGRWK